MRDRKPYRMPDVPVFAGINPKKLHAPAFAGDPAVMGDVEGCRIPALISAMAPDGSGVLIAAADVGNEGADWGNLGLAVRRSMDGGDTWEKLQTIVRLQAHHAPQGFQDWMSPFTIDPQIVQGRDGAVYITMDMLPESKGLAEASWMDQVPGYVDINGKPYLALYAGPSGVNGQDCMPGKPFTVREKGWVYTPDGIRTRYYLPQKHSQKDAFCTLGDLYYAVGKPDFLDREPPVMPEPPVQGGDIYIGNVFMSWNKPDYDPDNPQYVQKRMAGPGGKQRGYGAESSYPILETDPAPFRCAVTTFLWQAVSRDGGKTWSQPVDISCQTKREQDGPFLGVGPGAGLCLGHQGTPSRNGRLLLPLYNGAGRDKSAVAVYRDGDREKWRRASGEGYLENQDEVQLVELEDGVILSFGRMGTESGWSSSAGMTPVSISFDGGLTWKGQPDTPLFAVKCQKSVLAYPTGRFPYPAGMQQGRQYLIASHPTGESGYPGCPRTDGAISLGEIQEDYSIRWIAKRRVALPGQYDAADEEKWRNFFAYSCMAVLSSGDIGLLYEPQPNNLIAYTRFNLEWVLEGDSI